jgi:hypothetical protein
MRTLHRFDKVWLADRALGGTEPLAEEFYYMGLGFPRRTVRIAVVEMERQNCVCWPRGVFAGAREKTEREALEWALGDAPLTIAAERRTEDGADA